MTRTTAPAGVLRPPDDALAELDAALQMSPADETEIVWIASRRQQASMPEQRAPMVPVTETVVLVRVLEGERLGLHRTGGISEPDLRLAIRQAIAQSRSRDPITGLPHLPADPTPVAAPDNLDDEQLRFLTPAAARDWMRPAAAGGAPCRLAWVEAAAAIASSRGLRRTARVTAAQLAIERRAPGAAPVRAATRRLDDLSPERLLERARRRSVEARQGEWDPRPVPAVFAPEAVQDLIDLLNRVAFSAVSYAEGTSLLREHLGVQVFDRRFQLVDDATAAAGLPFPFDLEGSAKRRVDLISDGIPRTPALDQRQAAALGLPPTAHAVGGNDALAQNLFLLPGEETVDELLRRADGGLWIPGLDSLECFGPHRVQIRATLRGACRIEEGRPAAPVPGLVWQGSLLRSVANLVGIARDPQLAWGPDRGVFGGISAPALAVDEISGLRLAD